ncbi:uncharacterized protein SPSK_00087 [Sporothrix schenckii 1099-18]|uniref:LPXTG-domain-containing protein n=1 Tax=Sporothrix schenckii 1099-18 TaxID=1397361 RepID=A0A0F2M240_SPOSC|nr:uncharacterized protein SPSK_00087 [Sporothrix schenckii 1099-18]KJR83772.1 hypothetical protein SPSK_00087 [Sporothrix schenckii 1099-18]
MSLIRRSGRLATAVVAAVLSLGLFSTAALAIQVTPNSPCASLCIDSAGLDTSDPNSSNTVNADIVCNDADFASKSAGKKWTACMGCLQNSTFSQGAESDQAWFFYNLRYNVDYCIFGYPDAGDAVGSSPCQTSTACGPLQGSLYDGVPRMGNHTEFGYCTANGTTLSSSQFKGCTACVGGSGDQNIVANSLIALEAGCLQQLPPDEAVGLSGSVFASATTISIVAPTQTSGSGSGASGSGTDSRHVATTTIAVIVVVALLAVAAIGGFAFVCYRKRRGSARRGAAGSKSIFGKNKEQDGFYGAEGGFGEGGGGGGGGSSGFVPSGGIRGSGLGGFVSVPTGGASVRGSPASAADPNAWSSRFPSSEVITSPLSFQCRASATSLGDMVDRKVVAESVAESAPPAATVPSNRGGGHSRSSSTGSVEMGVALQEQQLQQQVQSASRRKHQKPQAISSAAIHAAINAAAASHSTATTISSTNSLGSGGSSGHLSAIVESPFPSPAPAAQTGNGADGIGNIGMRIHSIDFDKKGYAEAAAAVSQSSPPRLHQLKTSFSPYLGTNSSPSYNTPTSSTALLSSTSLTGQLPSPPTGHSVYNPSVYAPAHGAAGPSPTAYTNISVAAAAGQRGVYQGWSAMVSAAQQYQQQQLQQQHLQNSATTSMPASAVGSYRGEREPASAVSVVSVVSVASLASSHGLGAATMAARQTFSDREPQSAGGAGDVSATSMHPPGGGFPPVSSAASSVRQHNKSPHGRSPHTKAKLPLGSGKPSHARSPHTQTELVQTEFLPPPPARTRR